MDTSNTPQSEILKPKRTAAILGVTVKTLANWRERHYGPAWQQYGNLCRYRSDDVLSFIDAHTQRPA